MRAQEVIEAVEASGGRLALSGEKLAYELPATAADLVGILRQHKAEIAEILRERQAALGSVVLPGCPPLPPGVRLLRYAPKTPPVAIQPCSIVTDVNKFIRAYLRDLEWRLAHPKTYACAPLPEILAKLAEVGVELDIDASRQR